MTDQALPPRRRSWPLIVSLLLNVLLIALIVGTILRIAHRDTGVGAGGVLAPRSVMAVVPNERDNIQKVIDAHAQKIRELRQRSIQTRRDSFTALTAPDYTPEKFAKLLDAIRVADGALEAESIAMMADSLATLTPAERAAVVEKVRKRNNSWLYRMLRPKPN